MLALRRFAQPRITSHASGHDDRSRTGCFRFRANASKQLLNDCALKRGEQVECRLRCHSKPFLDSRSRSSAQQLPASSDFLRHIAFFKPAKDSRLQSTEAEVGRVALDLGDGKPDRSRIAIRGKFVDHRSARIAKAEELRHLVESLSSSIVSSFAEQAIVIAFANLKQVRVSAARHQRQRGELDGRAALAGFHDHRMNVPLDMIHGNQRHMCGEAEGLCIGNADKKRPDETGPLGHCNRIDRRERDSSAPDGFAHDRDDRAQMLSRSEFGNDTTVLAVHVELRSHDRGQNSLAIFDDSSGCFITGGLYGENAGHHCYSTVVRVADFAYELPPELIAQEPLEDRSASRMLVLHRKEGRWEDRVFRELPGLVAQGDCLILNDSRVFASRLYATRSSGPARIEVFLVRTLSEDKRTWWALVRPGRKVGVGEQLRFSNSLSAEVLDRGEHGERTLRFAGDIDVLEEADRIGHVPLPPYIRREDRTEDRTRYQTVYAEKTGSVAAPTAGLHFTPAVLERCRAAGAEVARVTLHVGLGTFAPLHVENLEEVQLHFEQFEIADRDLSVIQAAKRRIAVGTTTVRTLETVYTRKELSGETDLFISPGYKFHAVDAMITNFHLPESSLLMLVSAFAGQELTKAAYRHAVEQRYRFFSYGDCMLIL